MGDKEGLDNDGEMLICLIERQRVSRANKWCQQSSILTIKNHLLETLSVVCCGQCLPETTLCCLCQVLILTTLERDELLLLARCLFDW